MQEIRTDRRNPLMRIFLYFSIAWLVLFATLVGYVDFDPTMAKMIQISDYLMTFHTAGYAVTHGQLAALYPPQGALQFAGMPFDRLAHLVLPLMPPASVSEFMYMPLAATVFVPFSQLPLNLSLFAWQVVSLISLWASTIALMDGRPRTVGFDERARRQGVDGQPESEGLDGQPGTIDAAQSGTVDAAPSIAGLGASVQACLFSLLLLPSCVTIWIGQVGLVFGVLPLSLGYFFLRRQRPILAGLIWSLCLFKPQFLVPLSLPLLSELLCARFKAIAGFVAGSVAIVVTSVVCFSPQLNIEWLQCLKVADYVYSDIRSGVARQIAVSLPRTLILMLSPEQQQGGKMIIYGLAGAILVSGAYLIFRITRASWRDSISSLSAQEFNAGTPGRSVILPVSLIVSVFITPLVVPHMFLYDFSLFAVAAPLAFTALGQSRFSLRIKQLVVAAWLLLNLYTIIVMSATKIAQPLLFVALLLAQFVLLYRCVLSVPVSVSKTDAAA